MTRFAIACAFFFLSFHATAQTYLSCDFENGIPADFTLHDYDGNTPSSAMKKAGFDVGIPWIATTTDKAGNNHAACSTSWYTPAGTSDDWLITPAVTLSGSNPQLSWRAMAADAKHADGYTVYISTNAGTEKGDFLTATPLFDTKAESAEWSEHMISLAQYAGQTVRIAFVNTSHDCSRLFVDDITVGESHKAYVSLNIGSRTNRMGEIALGGTVTTHSQEPIDGFTIGVEADGTATTQHFDLPLSAGSPAQFTLDRKLNIGKHQTLDYTVWVEADGDRNSIECSLTSYPRKMLCEEATGTWCAWCVRGIVALDSIRNHYANSIIGIAAHQGDVMDCGYSGQIGKYLGSGLPTGTVNRAYTCDPKSFIDYSEALFGDNEPLCDMTLGTEFDSSSRTVSATTTLLFADAQHNANYALAYAIVENSVHQPGNSKYQQHNAYANGENGIMGGYEKYGEYIPSEVMYYNDVARGYADDLMGISGSVPTEIDAETPVVHNIQISLPDNILDDSNVEIVAMLLDLDDGHVVNAEKCGISAKDPAGIHSVDNNGSIAADAIYNVNGMRTHQLQRGLNIVRTSDGRVVKIIK